MQNFLGDIIFNARQKQNLTQDQYGSLYDVSGPAVFKFEKGYVRPSLPLWLRMANDAGITERRAVLLWIKSKLPQEYQEYIELQGAAVAESKKVSAKAARGTGKKSAYPSTSSREDVLAAARKDASLPPGLLELIEDDELWSLYKPSGGEIEQLRDIFSPLGSGSKHQYREALQLVREFKR